MGRWLLICSTLLLALLVACVELDENGNGGEPPAFSDDPPGFVDPPIVDFSGSYLVFYVEQFDSCGTYPDEFSGSLQVLVSEGGVRVFQDDLAQGSVDTQGSIFPDGFFDTVREDPFAEFFGFIEDRTLVATTSFVQGSCTVEYGVTGERIE